MTGDGLYLRFRKDRRKEDISLNNFHYIKFKENKSGTAEDIFGNKGDLSKVEKNNDYKFYFENSLFKVNSKAMKIAYVDVETYFPERKDSPCCITFFYNNKFYCFADGFEKKKTRYEMDW